MRTLTPWFKLYVIALVTFLIIDFLWIGVFANQFYTENLGDLLSETPNLTAALLFYLMFVAGIVHFAVWPAIRKNLLRPAVTNAAVFGLMTYGTYDLVNYALIRHWPLAVTVVDMIWGVSVSITVTVITLYCGRRLSARPGKSEDET